MSARLPTKILFFIVCATLFSPSATVAQSISSEQQQFCNIIISARAQFKAFRTELAATSNPIVRQEISQRANNFSSSAIAALQNFINNHLNIDGFLGTVAFIGANTRGGSGANVLTVLDCPPHPKEVIIQFEMRFDARLDPVNWAAIGPFLDVLRAIKKSDRLMFSGTWGFYEKSRGAHFGDDNNPAQFVFITSKLTKL